MKIKLGEKILGRNEQFALQNRRLLRGRGILCLNVISSPGSGKTTLLARTVEDLKGKLRCGVIEGDIKTDLDAVRIRAAGAPAVQIQTEGACHLSAQQVSRALSELPLESLDVVFIENVGNLVCPSAFDLGEDARAVLLSIPEGDDKPAKYPATFAGASVVLINKIDLLEYIPFDIDRALKDLRSVNPDASAFQVSVVRGDGMQTWYDWLFARRDSVADLKI